MKRERYLVSLEDAKDPYMFGGKAAQLNLAIRHRLPVPKGYAISASLLSHFVSNELSLENELSQILNELGPIAVRSSAIGEDSQHMSYAGQYDSFLNVDSIPSIKKAIIAVHESKYSKRVKLYNERFGNTDTPKMAVILQQMVAAEVSGILFTQDPVSKADEVIIEASRGLGELIASGQVTPDFFRLSKTGQLLEQRTGDRTVRSVCLNELELQMLHDLTIRCEYVFGKDLDIEWAFDKQKLCLLQCRPITC